MLRRPDVCELATSRLDCVASWYILLDFGLGSVSVGQSGTNVTVLSDTVHLARRLVSLGQTCGYTMTLNKRPVSPWCILCPSAVTLRGRIKDFLKSSSVWCYLLLPVNLCWYTRRSLNLNLTLLAWDLAIASPRWMRTECGQSPHGHPRNMISQSIDEVFQLNIEWKPTWSSEKGSNWGFVAACTVARVFGNVVGTGR